MIRTITHAKEIQKKSRQLIVRQIRPNWYKVSGGPGSVEYDVNLGRNGGTCACAWGHFRPASDHRSGCSHVIAALNYRAIREGKRVSVWVSEADALRQHRPIISIGDGLLITTRTATA